MRNLFNILVIVAILSGCNSWIDFTSDKWKLDEYVSEESLSFGESTESHTLYISNNGGHSKISFSISANKPWIIPAITSGVVGEGKDQSIKVDINRTLLPEGKQMGSLSIKIDDIIFDVLVTAVGYNDIIITPSYINFGSIDDVSSISLLSKSGRRVVELSPSASWLSLSSNNIELDEYDSNRRTGEQSVSIKCSRGDLPEGEHSAEIVIKSQQGEHLFSLPVSVIIPNQNPLSVAIDNYVFTLSKHLYWNGNDVILELSIKNHKYLKEFEIDSNSSNAIGEDNNTYPITAISSSIHPNEVDTMKIYIKNVPKNLKSFNRITLQMKDLSKPIVFTNVEL